MSVLDPQSLDLRLILARALASEHGRPLGFFDEADQLDWDRKAQAVLRDMVAALVGEQPS